MANLRARLWRWRLDWLPVSALVLGIGLSLLLSVNLTMRVVPELRALATSGDDNITWIVSQTEVEILELQRVVLSARAGQSTPDDIRFAFDVLYSRLEILRDAPLYRAQVRAAESTAVVEALGTRMDGLLPVIDGSDAELMAATDRMMDLLPDLRADVHAIASRVTHGVAMQQEALRNDVFMALRNLAVVAVLLMGFMAGLTLIVWRQFRMSRAQANELRQTTTRLSTIVTTSQDAIVVTDGANRITEFNAAAEGLFGLSRSAALGQPIEDLADVSTLDAAERRSRVKGRCSDSRIVPLEASLGEEQTLLGVVRVYVFRDISHRLANERDLKDSRDRALAGERAKARFMAVMSHEMRTPLNGILGVIDLLRAEADGAGRGRMSDYLDILEGSGETLLGHVNEVLDFTEIESSDVVLRQEAVDLEALSRGVIRGFAPAAKARGVQLHHMVHLPAGARVQGDPVRLRQILTNLLDNALKHTPDGSVTLEISAGGMGVVPVVEIQVTDTGIGIAPEGQDRIFDDFVRLEPADGMVREGTGLGLGITRRLVEAMGGEIGVESEPGSGSVFWVRLPLPVLRGAQGEAFQGPDKGPDGAADRAARVLVVEDNPVNRFILREMLEKDGHIVDEAADGAQGVAAAQAAAYDLILMDISMPVMDGAEAARAIRQTGAPNATTRIVALTAHIHAADDPDTAAAGFDQVVTKPVTWAGLRALLRGQSVDGPMRPVEDGQGLPVLDPAGMDGLARTLDGPARAAFVAGFRKEAEALVGILQKGTAPPELLRRHAHALAGAAAIAGAKRLHARLSDLEAALMQGDAAPPPTGDLPSLMHATCAALEVAQAGRT
ncbi:ATP-binding protein [Lacimonas salitolerans]|uniref:histidine kinase n=1 Tax=Lacimonas salitolerans TaxID=1323750 RepID=A0ABW4EBC5_9RHOB